VTLNSWALTEESILEWLHDSRMRIRSPKSQSTYKAALRMFAVHVGHKRLANITQQDLLSFLSNRALAPNTQASYVTVVEKYFDWAIWKGRTKSNPVAGLQFVLNVSRRNVREGTWLDRQRVVDLFAETALRASQPERDTVVLGLGFLCGFRLADITSLRWGQVDGDTAEIVGKGSKPALITFPPELVDAMRIWRAAWREQSGAYPLSSHSLVPRCRTLNPTFQPGCGTDVVLWGTPGGRCAVAGIVQRAGLRIGVPHLAPHDMRRTYCGLLEAEGLPLQDIAALMRHDSISTTQTYLRKNPARRQAQARGFRLGIGGTA
jgi:integrase